MRRRHWRQSDAVQWFKIKCKNVETGGTEFSERANKLSESGAGKFKKRVQAMRKEPAAKQTLGHTRTRASGVKDGSRGTTREGRLTGHR